jgi:hypothetical protein
MNQNDCDCSCPKCGSLDFEQTCMGFGNKAWCKQCRHNWPIGRQLEDVQRETEEQAKLNAWQQGFGLHSDIRHYFKI